jgi:hypothetical protein
MVTGTQDQLPRKLQKLEGLFALAEPNRAPGREFTGHLLIAARAKFVSIAIRRG